MGVYIKCMKMPKNCEDCPCVDYKNWRCQVDDLWYKEHCTDSGRPDWCPLVPVPPHGNLKDADALFKEMERKGWYNNADRDMAEDLVYYAPTIIPADNPKEE